MTRKHWVAAIAVTLAGVVAPLHAAAILPAIQGTVSQLGSGGVSGVTLNLYEDDGDGIFNAGDTMVGSAAVSAGDGSYMFEGLNGTASYFVERPAQTVGSIFHSAQVSSLITPGAPNLIIDNFDNNQGVTADTYTSTLSDPLAVVLGVERDMYVRLVSGVGQVGLRSNAFGVAVLQYDTTSGVVGHGIITWDGVDMSASPTPSLGLGNLDLTQGGLNEGIVFNLGIDATGAGDQLHFRIFGDDASVYSEGIVTIPITDGTASGTAYLPFSSLVGPVTPDSVNAIQLIMGDGAKSVDAQFDQIGALGPKTQNFELIPEPASLTLALSALLGLLGLRRKA